MCDHDYEGSLAFDRIKGSNFDIVTTSMVRQCFFCGSVERRKLHTKREYKNGYREDISGSPSRFGT